MSVEIIDRKIIESVGLNESECIKCIAKKYPMKAGNKLRLAQADLHKTQELADRLLLQLLSLRE